MAVIYVRPTPTDPLTPVTPTDIPVRPDLDDLIAEINRRRAAGEFKGIKIFNLPATKKPETEEETATGVPFVAIGLVAALIFVIVKKRKPNVRN